MTTKYLRPAKIRYQYHKGNANKRGIPFQLSFEEWYQWWLDQGIDKNLTPPPNDGEKLCMCRYQDQGPYSLDNIYCDTMRNNLRYGHRVGTYYKTKTSCHTPLGSFTSKRQAARHHGVTLTTISRWIKTKPNDFYLL